MKKLAFVLRTLISGWFTAFHELLVIFCRLMRRCHRADSGKDRAARTPCVKIDQPAFVRPDPLIYSQRYLSGLGFAVTWDNPDIELQLNGVPVSSSLIEPGKKYEVVARIWNGSPSAPVVGMPVHFSYLDFGIGTVSIPIGSVKVDLGVKGGPHHPAFARMPWVTPKKPGHYCIQVLLDPPDDINRINNLGQENTNVGEAHSPATFNFTLRNDTRRTRSYRLEVDTYMLGKPDPCDDLPIDERARDARMARHRRDTPHQVPAGWQIEIDPETPLLAPGEVTLVKVVATPPNDFTGTQPLNVNAFHDEGLAGGVTLFVINGP